MKSWTDDKPQIAIWTDAWLKFLTLIRADTIEPCPAFPLVIAQGHDWHIVILSKDDQGMAIRE